MNPDRSGGLIVPVTVVAALLGWAQPALPESQIDALLASPQQARSFDYCAWSDTRQDDDSLPDFATLLEDEDSMPPQQRAATALTKAGTSIANTTSDPRSCRKIFDNGRKVFDKDLAKWRKKLSKKERLQLSKDPAIATVQQKISDLWVNDQAARKAYLLHRNVPEEGAPYWTRSLATAHAIEVDAEATAYMQELLEQYDWVDAHRFGEPIARHAWLLVQHADRHPDFQQLALERMAGYLDNGGVRKRDYAYLWDRVAVNHDRKQRYGTQPDWNCQDGKMQLKPLEDPDSVDQRRAEMDLGPVQQDLEQMNRATCGR